MKPDRPGHKGESHGNLGMGQLQAQLDPVAQALAAGPDLSGFLCPHPPPPPGQHLLRVTSPETRSVLSADPAACHPRIHPPGHGMECSGGKAQSDMPSPGAGGRVGPARPQGQSRGEGPQVNQVPFPEEEGPASLGCPPGPPWSRPTGCPHSSWGHGGCHPPGPGRPQAFPPREPAGSKWT